MKASEKRLQEVLSLRRLQSLRCIHLQTPDLVFKLDPWHSDQKYSLKNVESRFAYRSKEAGLHLQMIRNHPWIRKLSLKTSFRGSPSEKEAAKLADILVKFDELDLTEVTWFLQSCEMSRLWRIYPCKKSEVWGKKSRETHKC